MNRVYYASAADMSDVFVSVHATYWIRYDAIFSRHVCDASRRLYIAETCRWIDNWMDGWMDGLMNSSSD